MSNTNAAEVAAKEEILTIIRNVAIAEASGGEYDGDVMEEVSNILAGYTAALSNVLKWTKIDAENLPDGGWHMLRRGDTIQRKYMAVRMQWNSFLIEGYTHYLPETDLLTKIEIE